ncbi:MAG: NUDIX hydrolase [Acidobacteria bacterium]|nr:NUDIX hydrolase [Acidobacteriota bacterium]
MTSSSTDPEPSVSTAEVRAAGGVVWRVVDGAIRVALIHRPRYDDWTFPKGKVESGEADEQTAHREVLEETGLDCVLGRELRSVAYRDDRGRSKRVRYWEMTIAAGEFVPNEEADRLIWATLTEARGRLTYRHDVSVLESFRRLTSA